MSEVKISFNGKTVTLNEYKVLYPDTWRAISYYRLVGGDIKDLPPGLIDRDRIVEVSSAKRSRAKAGV